MGRGRAGAVILIVALGLGGCASPFDDDGGLDLPGFSRPTTAVDYRVEANGAPNDDVAAALEETLSLWRRRDEGAPSLAMLRRRAEQDETTAKKLLKSEGYFAAEITTRVAAPGAAGGEALVTLSIAPGPAFTLVEHRFIIVDRELAGAVEAPQVDTPVGMTAAAAPILAAEETAVAALRRDGRPWANLRNRRAIADLDAATLKVESYLIAGPAARFGPTRFDGADSVDDAYLLSYQPWDAGDPANVELLREYQRKLMATGLFEAGSVELSEEGRNAEPDGAAAPPVLVTLEERPFRTFTAGLRYDTDAGPGARVGFAHRNLFGANEQIELTAEGATEEQRVDAAFRKPQFLQPGQDLTAALSLRHTEDDAFDETGATASVGVERMLGERWRVGAGALVEVARVVDNGVDEDVALFGVPTFARYDRSNDLLNPTEGWRANLLATPFVGSVDGATASFFTLDGQVAGYLPLDDDGEFVLAGRARLASILSENLGAVPANRRLYSGGGGSVRGYRERYIGPLDSDGEPVGGRSAIELGAELRARLWGDFGGVVFVEGGSVSASAAPDFDQGLQTAAGVGLRYYSPIGPIRADVAAPIDPRPQDDAFQIYLSIGQAF